MKINYCQTIIIGPLFAGTKDELPSHDSLANDDRQHRRIGSRKAHGSHLQVQPVDSNTLIALIFAGTVAVIAWVMSEALDIAEENKQFV